MVAKMTKEIQRILKPETGLYMAISYGKPESRVPHFAMPHLSFHLRQFVLYPAAEEDPDGRAMGITEEEKEEKSHYIYLCRKRADADEVCRTKWLQVQEDLTREAEAENSIHRELREKEEDESENMDEDGESDRDNSTAYVHTLLG
jgi:hypothetical protein